MLLRFIRLLLSSPRVTLQLVHPRRVRNALKFLLFDSGNLAQLYRRYQDIYSQPDIAASERIEALAHAGTGARDIILFPVIDWHFRLQRPQHLATQLAARGFRVFYLSAVPMLQDGSRRYRLTDNPKPGVFLCKLRAEHGLNDDIHRSAMHPRTREEYLASLAALMNDFGIVAPIFLLQHHYWEPVARKLPAGIRGYDCMDHHLAFHEPDSVGFSEQEAQLIRDCDFVIASSTYLHDRIARIRPCAIVRNGCDFDFFASTPRKPVDPRQPVVGYVGAIAEWFDLPLLIEVAQRLSTWRFVLVGSQAGCDIGAAKSVPNLQFVGEIDYAAIVDYMATFDICIIPFRLTELTRATNPVKAYEYLAAGRPVVSTPLPEVVALGEHALIADTPEAFVAQLRRALQLAGEPGYAQSMQAWAREQDWSHRAGLIEALIDDARD